MRRKRNTAGIPYSVGGRGGAFAVLVVAIAGLALAAGYSASNLKTATDGVTTLAARDTPVRVQANPARAARAARLRAVRRARVLARRAVARRVAARRIAARRAAARAARRHATTVVVTERAAPAFSATGANLCAPIGPRGHGRVQRQLRHRRAIQRRRTLSYLNLHC